MAGPSALMAVEYAPETLFAEASSTFATHRVPVLMPVDLTGLIHPKEEPGRVEQYMQGYSAPVKMTQTGSSFTIDIDMTGHGATTAGTPSIDALETLLGYAFGNVSLAAATSTTATGGTATAVTTAASATFAAGSIAHIGTGGISGEQRGGGQLYAVGSHVSTTLTLLNAMIGAPTNGDVIRPTVMMHPPETPVAGLDGTVPGLRFRFGTNNLSYACHGCYPTNIELTGTNTGERPKVRVTFGVARWDVVTPTFPSAVTSNQYNPAPIAAGSLFVNAVGTATRSVRSYRNFAINYALKMEAVPGPGGVSVYQGIVACRRIGAEITVSWTEDADSPTTTPALNAFYDSSTPYHLMWTGSVTPGSGVGIYLPRMFITDPVPVQRADGNLNRISVTGRAATGATTTTELTRSAFKLCYF